MCAKVKLDRTWEEFSLGKSQVMYKNVFGFLNNECGAKGSTRKAC